MSEGNAFEFNNNVAGKGTQINQGQNVTASQTNQVSDGATFDQFITALREGVASANGTEGVKGTAADELIIEPLREIAAQPEPTNEQDRTTLKARIMTIVEQLEPYTPYIRKTVAAFAEGALMTIPPPASWIVAGCIEVVRDARNRD